MLAENPRRAAVEKGGEEQASEEKTLKMSYKFLHSGRSSGLANES